MDRQIINKYNLSDSVPRQKLNPYRTLKSVYLFTSDFLSVHQECAEKSSLQMGQTKIKIKVYVLSQSNQNTQIARQSTHKHYFQVSFITKNLSLFMSVCLHVYLFALPEDIF